MYITLIYKDKMILFVVCPHCESMTQITSGKPKKHKVRQCWNCGSTYVEEG